VSAANGPPVELTGHGYGYMVQAAAWFAVMSLLVKLAGEALPTMVIVFVRGCVTLLLGWLMLRRAGLTPRGNRTGLLLLRGVFGSAALVCYYGAVVHLPLAEATVIHKTAPLFTAVVAAAWLHEKLEPRVLVAMAFGLAGVVCIAQPEWLCGTGTAFDRDWRFVAVGSLAAVLSAFAYASVRLLGRTEHALVVVFWFPIVTVTGSAPFALLQWTWPDAFGWVLLAGIGISTQLAQLALTRGLARTPAARAMTVDYLQIAFATVLGAIVFGELPDLLSWLGIAVIVGSLIATTRR
jgi:drug/metabolite transporter (DMT)-like permease